MKQTIILSVKKSAAAVMSIILPAIILISCEKEVTEQLIAASIYITIPENVIEIKADTFIFTNISTLTETKYPASEKQIMLPAGFYNLAYRAEIQYQNGETVSEGLLRGLKESITVTAEKPVSLSLQTFIAAKHDDFIIEEIFFTGTLRPSGTQYYGDAYIKIYNNTGKTLYADGVAILESKFLSVQKYDYIPDIRSDTFTVHAVYIIPGSGTDHPVAPGQSLTICDTGIDHRLANPNSIDHSGADFEWYDLSNSPSTMDIDSDVPNLDKYYCYTFTIWVLHNRGFKSYAIARMNENRETYLQNYLYTYKYVMHLPQGDYTMTQTAYKIPNSWILDGVNCSVEPERVWNILPPSVDAGWTHCGLMDSDKDRYFKSVRRKMLYVTQDGTRILKDTNNSTEDFNTESIPSIIEEQNSAINAQGTPAAQQTWDGKQVKN
jgi:hypothetical protein